MHEKFNNNINEKNQAEKTEKLSSFKPDVKESKRINNKIKNFIEKKFEDPKFHKKVLAAGALIDLVSGWASVREVPQEKVKDINLPSGLGTEIIEKSDEKKTESTLKDFFARAGLAVENIGSDESNALGFLEDNKRCEDGNDNNIEISASDDVNKNFDKNKFDADEKNLKEFEFKNKIKKIDLEIIDNKDIVESFLNGEYKTFETLEDLTFYRVYGGGSEKDGNPKGEYVFLTPSEPKDRMTEKMDSALSNKWQGNFDGVLKVPNTREYYCEVYVPKGTHINIGKVAPQETLGGQLLNGGGEQIIVKRGVLSFGQERKMDYWGNYLKFEKKAKKIEDELNK